MKSIDLGLVDYKKAHALQKEYLEKVIAGEEEVILFCSHPPLITLGRGTKAEDILSWDGEKIEVERGGRVTYHGPEQIISYPIVDLSKRNKDLHAFMRLLETAAINTLEHYGIEALGDKKDATGVWVKNKKIASIGIAVKKWVTYHGIAININKDNKAFTGISPCGYQTSTMTCLEDLRGEKMSKAEFQVLFEEELISLL